MADTESQGAGDPSDEQEVDPPQLTDEELRAFFSGEEVSEETPDTEADNLETETQEEETEAGNTAEETETEEERLAKMRVRPKDDKDQQVLDLYKSEGWNKSLAEAAAVIHGTNVAQPEETPQAEGNSPASDENVSESTLDKLNSEVAALEKEAKEAADDLDTVKAFELQQQIMNKRIEALREENELQRQQERAEASQYEEYRQKTIESRDRALARFPVLQDKESVERKLFDNFVKEKQADHDYASVFDSPKWVELMANEFSQAHDLSGPTAPDLVDHNPPSKTNTKVLTSATKSSSKPKGKITPDGVRDNMHRLDRDTLYKMLGQE